MNHMFNMYQSYDLNKLKAHNPHHSRHEHTSQTRKNNFFKEHKTILHAQCPIKWLNDYTLDSTIM